jgi:hypothetical protein
MMMRGLRALNHHHLKPLPTTTSLVYSSSRRLFASSSSLPPSKHSIFGHNGIINWTTIGVVTADINWTTITEAITWPGVGVVTAASVTVGTYVMNAAHQRKLAEENAAHQCKLAEENAAHQRKLAEENAAHQSSHQHLLELAMGKLSKPFEPVAFDGPYIPRVHAEAAIHTYIRDDKFENGYLVVSGPKGSGKSTVINQQLADRIGVFHVQIESKKNSPPTIALDLAKSLSTENLSGLQGSPDMFILEVCREFHKKHGKWPIVVFNVQGDRPNPEDLATLSKQLGHFQKYLSCDECVARTIADISAIAIAAGMLHDANRARFVAVPELSPDQALEMLEPYSHSLQQHRVVTKDIVHQIGGNPQQLQYVASDGAPAAAITAILDDAEQQVKSYLDNHPTHHAALRQLLLKLYDVGMREVDFDDVVRAEKQKLPAAAAAVADPGVQSVSDKFRVIHKNLQSKHVVFHTYPHYIVAKKILLAEEEEKKVAEKILLAEEEEKKGKSNQ